MSEFEEFYMDACATAYNHDHFKLNKPQRTDKQIKAEATKEMSRSVFEDMNAGEDIFAECSDGVWVREYWRNPNGYFGWGKWKRLR